MKIKYLIPIILIVLVFGLMSCSASKTNLSNATTIENTTTEITQPQNKPPVAIIRIDGQIKKLNEINFNASDSYDGDNDILTYEWILPNGIKSNEKSVNFMLDKFGTYEVKLTVSDGKTQSTDIESFEVINSAPVAISNVSEINCKLGESVELNANKSYDSDNDPLTYEWTLPNGETLEGLNITFTPEKVGIQNITLTVSDGDKSGKTEISIDVLISEEDFKKSCKNVKYGDLLRNPIDYIMKQIHVKGQIVQYISDTEFHFNITKGSYGFWDDRTWLILNNPSEENIIEDDIVEVWGFGGGNQDYETVMGATKTIPLIFAEYVEIIQKAD